MYLQLGDDGGHCPITRGRLQAPAARHARIPAVLGSSGKPRLARGRSRAYRYYTCFTRVRYDSGRCSASRLDADAVEEAVVAALASFYRDEHDLIADAITQAQALASHGTAQDLRRAELAATEHEWSKRARLSTGT